MKEIIIARHGNTFKAGDKIVWVGRNEDYPLTEEGENQARLVAETLQNTKIDTIYSAPLKRTLRFAEIVAEKIGVKPQIDNRLLEIDYGAWGGKSDAEIENKEELKAWSENGIWPKSGVWGSTEGEIRAAIHSFAQEIVKNSDERVLVVSSNGCIRFFAELLSNRPQELYGKGLKVKTGFLCSITYNDGVFSLNYWNRNPKDVG